MAQEPPKVDDSSSSHPAPSHPAPPAQSPPSVAGSSLSQSNPTAGTLPSFPAILPGINTVERAESNSGAGLYAVACYPTMGLESVFPPSALIPLKYSIPTRQASATGATGEQGPEVRQQQGPQRQVAVRRFHFAFQLDVILIIKLAAMVFLLSQDGSELKLVLLILFASVVYLYQTGALTPFVRWLQRVGAPPPRQPPIQPQNDPAVGQIERNNAQPDNQPGVENQNPPENNNNANQAANGNQPEPGRQGPNWWGVVKEIQMFVVGFITSLLPGVHNND